MSELQEYIKKMQRPLGAEAQAFVARVARENGTTLATKSFFAPTQPMELLRNEQPRFEFGFRTAAGIDQVQQPWSEKLEEEFFRIGLRLDTPISEALRGGTLLLSNMQWPDLQFNRDFTDHVIWRVVNERFGNVDLVRELLAKIPNNDPTGSKSYPACAEFVKSSINGYGNGLVLQLHYSDPSAYPILVAAVVYFLNIRFSLALKEALYPNRGT